MMICTPPWTKDGNRGGNTLADGTRDDEEVSALRHPMNRVRRKARSPLDPAFEPHGAGYLTVSDVHRIHYEESGNPRGKSAVFLHGGPGGGTDPKMRRFFNPRTYRLVLFDQRGCGKSKPHGSLVDNTT